MKKIIKIFSFFSKLNLKTIYLLAVGVFFIGGNILLVPLALRLDLSQGKVYSLSYATKKIVKKLKKNLEIKFYLSSQLPTKLIPLKTDVVDFLKEYQKISNKVTVKIIDPQKDSKSLEEVQKEGVPQLQFSQLERDKYEVKNVYFAILINYNGKKEIISQATDLGSLEYNLTAAIYKLSKEKIDKLAIIGKREQFFSQADDLSTFNKVLSQQYDLNFVDIFQKEVGDKIDLDYKTILVFDDNEKTYEKDQIEKIDNYLKNGGKAIFFVDGIWVTENLIATSANHQLFDFFADWGIKLNRNLILSTSAEMVNFGNQQIQFLTVYPYWIRTNNFDWKKTLFNNINQLTFTWVSSIDLSKKVDTSIEVLVKSNKNSWQVKESSQSAVILDPQSIPQPDRASFKEFNLIAKAKKDKAGEILIIPSSRFVLDNYLSRSSDNLEFIINVLNEFVSQGALSGINQRSVNFYPLPYLTESQKDILKYLNMLLLPSLFGFYGFLRLLKRR